MKADPIVKTVMIIDDEPENLNVLAGLLNHTEWDVCAFPRGELAIEAAKESPPDIILMDILMPDLNGYETCKRLKEYPQTADIPILFLSALSDPNSKIKAFQAGGVDYINKPFQEEEVLARVQTHLELSEHRRHLEDLVLQRSQELADVHRRLRIWDDAKDQWINLIAHEMRTPLTGIIGVAELLFDQIGSDETTNLLREGYEHSVERINKLISDATFLAEIDVTAEKFATEPVSCSKTLSEALQLTRQNIPGVAIEVNGSSGNNDRTRADEKLLIQAFCNLLFAASCCVPDHEPIELSKQAGNGTFRISLSIRGQALPETDLDTFFEIGGQRTLLKGGGDLGLSAALAKRILQLFSGTCSIRNSDPVGIVIQAEIPLCS